MADVFLACQLWDLVDEGLDQVLDLAQGQWGVTGLTIGCVIPPAAALRCRADAQPRIVRTAGGWCFPANPEHYAATRAKPRGCELFRGKDHLRRVVEACRERSLATRLAVHTATAGGITAKHPDSGCKDLFGDPMPERICLLNPDGQELIAATCRDIATQYGPDAIVLCDLPFALPESATSGTAVPFDLGSAGQLLLGVCFCESCLKHTGEKMDAQAALRAARARIERILACGQPDDSAPATMFSEDDALGQYLNEQNYCVGSLIRSICATISPPTIASIGMRSAAIRGMAEHFSTVHRVSVIATDLAPDAVEAAAGLARRLVNSEQRAEVQLPAFPRHGRASSDPESALLVRTLSWLAEIGVAGATLAEYGTIPADAHAGIRQAIRFSRRKSPGSEHPAGV